MLCYVMLVEIPDPEIILGIVLAFLGGLFALYLIYKIKPLMERKERFDSSNFERLEYYERQLIDMKIRLDSIELANSEPKSADYDEFRQVMEKSPSPQVHYEQKPKRRAPQTQQAPSGDSSNTVDYVLGLITDKAMTSRDIQIASQRSREHTARLMKKLFQDGYVKRDTKTKPFTYSITDKGRAKIGVMEYLQNSAA